MKILITGAAGFVGSVLAKGLLNRGTAAQVIGLDNLIRAGSERNLEALRRHGVIFTHGDIRNASDLESLPEVDYVIDAAANPSVLAGVDGRTSVRQLVEHNLQGTLNLLEFFRQRNAGLILLSTSRVYAIAPLETVRFEVHENAFRPAAGQEFPVGFSPDGLAETFSTAAPVSLYGATKLASETLALEYGSAFDFPVWINRCGVLAGAGQFGRPDQGIFAYWIHSRRENAPLKYIGFGGSGHQVRDCLHPADLLPLLETQFRHGGWQGSRLFNVSGGRANSLSLKQLNDWCDGRLGPAAIAADPARRRFDIPWMVLDHGKVTRELGWKPQTPWPAILEEIAAHAETHPDWLTLSKNR